MSKKIACRERKVWRKGFLQERWRKLKMSLPGCSWMWTLHYSITGKPWTWTFLPTERGGLYSVIMWMILSQIFILLYLLLRLVFTFTGHYDLTIWLTLANGMSAHLTQAKAESRCNRDFSFMFLLLSRENHVLGINKDSCCALAKIPSLSKVCSDQLSRYFV